MSSNSQDGPFLFVDSEGGAAEETYDSAPRRPYVHAAWEWLLERALRRYHILWCFQQRLSPSEAAEYLGGRKWGARVARTIGPGEWRRDDARSFAEPYRLPDVVYSMTPLLSHAYDLAGSRGFLDPDWDETGFTAEASLTTETSGTRASATGDWSWSTTHTSAPFELPEHAFFRMLEDYRPDDPDATASMAGADGSEVSVRLPYVADAVRGPDNLTTFAGEQVLADGYSELNADPLLGFPSRTDMDGITAGEQESSGAYGNSSATTEMRAAGALPGPVRRTRGSAVYTSQPGGSYDTPNGDWADRLLPDVSWGQGGSPTWWHANGFPKGLESVQPEALRNELTALSVTQPAIPPCLPWLTHVPDVSYDWYTDADFSGPASLRSFSMHGWPGAHISPLAATPHCMAQMLKALVKTVEPVYMLAFRVRASQVRRTVSLTATESSGDSPSTERHRRSETISLAGEGLMGGGESLLKYDLDRIGDDAPESADSIDASWSSAFSESEYPDTGDATTSTTLTEETETQSRTGILMDVTPLRTTQGVRERLKYLRYGEDDGVPWGDSHDAGGGDSGESGDEGGGSGEVGGTGGPGEADEGGSGGRTDSGSGNWAGSEADSDSGSGPGGGGALADDSKLLFPRWVRRWIKKAELFLVYETRLSDGSPCTRTRDDTRVEREADPDDPESLPETTYTYAGEGSGTRTSRVKKGVVRLGRIDMDTGTLTGSVDLVSLRRACDPEGGSGRTHDTHQNYSQTLTLTTETSTTSGGGRRTTTTNTVHEETADLPSAVYSRKSGLYAVVEWDFDTKDPPPLPGEAEGTSP